MGQTPADFYGLVWHIMDNKTNLDRITDILALINEDLLACWSKQERQSNISYTIIAFRAQIAIALMICKLAINPTKVITAANYK